MLVSTNSIYTCILQDLYDLEFQCNWIIVSRYAQNKDVFKTHADHSSINIILIKLL